MNHRIKKVQAVVAKEKWDYLIVDSPIDLFYLTGQQLSLGRLVIGKSQEILFVDGRYFEACKTALSFPVVQTQGYGKGSPFQKTCSFNGKKIAFDSHFTTYQGFQSLEQLNGDLIAVEMPIKRLREIKEEREIDFLRQSAQLCIQGVQKIIESLKEGVSEEDLAIELEIFWCKNGSDKLAFDPIIAFQENSSKPHYRAGKRRLKMGEIIQIDIGVMKDCYVSDVSRVVAFGVPNVQWKSIYRIVYEAQKQSLILCKPGVRISDIDAAARGKIEKEGFGKYFTHGLGHGLGLDVHELPVIKGDAPYGDRKLEPGMTITIEPGIYLPGQGGIRLEETLVITETGYEILTSLPIPAELPVY